MVRTLNRRELLALLDSSEPVLLPSARSAGWLRTDYNRQQVQAGRAVWKPPALHSWKQWLESLWADLLIQGHDDRALLNPLQDAALWDQVLRNSTWCADKSDMARRELVALAQSAAGLAASFRITARLRDAADGPDARAFADWHLDFTRSCERARVLPCRWLESAVAEHLQSGVLDPPPILHLAGFEHLRPAQEVLLGVLECAGTEVQVHALCSGSTESARATVQLASSEAQWDWTAQWLRQRLTTPQAEAPRLAVVFPAEIDDAAHLDTVLRQRLTPELQLVGVDPSQVPWVSSAQLPMESQPVLQHALLLLRWKQQPLSPQQVSTLLLSPYIAFFSPLEDRATLDLALKATPPLRPERDGTSLLEAARRRQIDLAPLTAWFRATPESALRTHSAWAEYTRAALHAAGWPGGRELTPAESAAAEAWDNLLDLLSTLDLIESRLSFAAFLEQLTQQLKRGCLPDVEETDVPIQVVTLKEAEGGFFDTTLLMHATDQQLSPGERVHPLLGLELQRHHGMPGTQPREAGQRARALLESLAARSTTFLAVFPKADAAGPLRPSKLIDDLGCSLVPAEELVALTSPAEPLDLQWAQDDTDLPPPPAPQVAGGARVLELQSACGFRAFAALRLSAAAPDSEGLGLSARQSGTVLHQALELFWKRVTSHSALGQLSAQGRRATARSVVQQALSAHLPSASHDAWTRAYKEVLEERFTELLDQWCRRELERAPFTVREGERESMVQVGPLELRIRPDRIDEVEGGLVFIDYKSSSNLRVDDWLGERPRLPQIPLYTMLRSADTVRGVAFAQLRAGQGMSWVHLQNELGTFPGKRVHDLETQHGLWQAELHRLAEAFASGDTAVAPKLYPDTCTFCGYRLLCRVDPHISGSDSAEPASGETGLG